MLLPCRTLVIAAACSLLCLNATAQTGMAGHDMAHMGEKKEIPPPEKLPAPLHMTGLGNSHLTVTATPEAQVWFDQGLNLVHDFWDYEAARAFEQAVRVDPNCAMCFWGLSRSVQGAYAHAALDTADHLKKHATKQEQLYIEASVAAERDSGSKPKPGKDSKATKSWRKAVANDPADLQAKIFLALSLLDGYDGYTDAGEPKAGTAQSIAIFEDILKTAPNDSAANHYWIHAMEPSSHPERAIPSAQLLASLAPASGHMVHMPGHIFYRTGDYPHAEHWFAASTAVDEAYLRDQHIDVDDDWNYVHNLMYAIANLMEEGKLQQATTLSAKLAVARGQFDRTLYIGSPRDSMTRINKLLPVTLRSGDWKGIQTLLAHSEPNTKLENLTFLSGELKQFATGMLAVQNGDLPSAQAASAALDAELKRKQDALKAAPKPQKSNAPPTMPVMATSMPDAMPQPIVDSLSIMSLELRGCILAAQKELPEAKALFTDAAKKEKDLGYREPPTYIRPVGETEGLALLGAGDATGAHDAYSAALVERPNSGFALYGLARSSEAAGHTDTARAEYTKFLEAWRDSDPSTPELAHARQFLTGQSVVASAH
jgi:tetratricopeptide (TPR) repeat protein